MQREREEEEEGEDLLVNFHFCFLLDFSSLDKLLEGTRSSLKAIEKVYTECQGKL